MLMRLFAAPLCVGLLVACGDAADPEDEQLAPSASEPMSGTGRTNAITAAFAADGRRD